MKWRCKQRSSFLNMLTIVSRENMEMIMTRTNFPIAMKHKKKINFLMKAAIKIKTRKWKGSCKRKNKGSKTKEIRKDTKFS